MSKIQVIQTVYPHLDDLTTPYGIVVNLFCGRLVRDRFNVLNQFSKINWVDTVDPIPAKVDMPIADLMDRRAQDFLGRSVAVQWSGGVDSSALLLALIKSGISKQDLKIYYDSASIEEYPGLFEWLLKNKYTLHDTKVWKDGLGNAEVDVITNGWCADQLFGSVFFYMHPEDYYLSLEELISKRCKVTPTQAEEAIATYKEMGKVLFGIEINNAAQLGWLINFCLKWSWVNTYNELFLLGTKNIFKTQVFYDTPYFQGWSLNNFPNVDKYNIYGKDASKYKKELKEYCNSIFPDKDFLLHKGKDPSWGKQKVICLPEDQRVVIKREDLYETIQLDQNLPFGVIPHGIDYFTKLYK